MYHTFITFIAIWHMTNAQAIYESDINFRIEPGMKTCFFEKGKPGQVLEAQYQVIDGQHGDLDISFDIIDPNGLKILSDYKKSQNAIIVDLEVEGDYVFCMDNSYSVLNSKLVFTYVLIEDKEHSTEAPVLVVDDDGNEIGEETLQWMGYENGYPYYLEVTHIADSMTRTLRKVVKARQLLDMYGAMKSRDNYLAFHDTFVVDVWSGFQISFMCIVGLVQVYMIKKLFNRTSSSRNMY